MKPTRAIRTLTLWAHHADWLQVFGKQRGGRHRQEAPTEEEPQQQRSPRQQPAAQAHYRGGGGGGPGDVNQSFGRQLRGEKRIRFQFRHRHGSTAVQQVFAVPPAASRGPRTT